MIVKSNVNANFLKALSLNGVFKDIKEDEQLLYFNEGYIILFEKNGVIFVKYKDKSITLTQSCTLYSFFTKYKDDETAMYFLNLVK